MVYMFYTNTWLYYDILLQENGPDLTWNDAKHICSKFVIKESVNCELILVYGHAGNWNIPTYIHVVVVVLCMYNYIYINQINKCYDFPVTLYGTCHHYYGWLLHEYKAWSVLWVLAKGDKGDAVSIV